MEWKAKASIAKGFGCALDSKNDINHYAYKNSTCIVAEHGSTWSFLGTLAKIIGAGSAYSGERFKDLLSLDGFENRIH